MSHPQESFDDEQARRLGELFYECESLVEIASDNDVREDAEVSPHAAQEVEALSEELSLMRNEDWSEFYGAEQEDIEEQIRRVQTVRDRLLRIAGVPDDDHQVAGDDDVDEDMIV